MKKRALAALAVVALSGFALAGCFGGGGNEGCPTVFNCHDM